MKKILLCFLFASLTGYAQTTVSFTLGPNDEDAAIDTYNPAGNYPNEIEYHMAGWTISSSPVTWRNLLKFNLTSIPQSAFVQQATLSLYFAPNNTYGAQHSSQSHSNACVLQKVTSLWAENTVTWNTQPSVTTLNEVVIPQSTSATQDYPAVDVTDMVRQMVNNPSSNLGFRLKMIDETPYARMIFGSGDNPVTSYRPVLNVTYFETCVSLTIDPSGEDAYIDDWNPTGSYLNEIEYMSGSWTISGTPVIWRNLFRFDMSSIPSTAVIQDARLSLFYARINNFSNAPHSSLTHSNESVIQRVTGPWQESFVNWNTQPSSTTQNELLIPQTVSDTQDFPELDVTALLQDMFADPQNSFGFMLKATDETPYGRMIFASGDNPDVTKRPVLRVCFNDPSAVAEPAWEDPAEVYPNPSDGFFTIRSRNGFSKATVLNNLGQRVVQVSLPAPVFVLDLSNREAGIYFLCLEGASGKVHKKIIVH